MRAWCADEMHRTSAVLLLTLPALLSAHPIFSLKLKQEKYDGTLRPSDPLVLEKRGVCTKTVVPERKSIDMRTDVHKLVLRTGRKLW